MARGRIPIGQLTPSVTPRPAAPARRVVAAPTTGYAPGGVPTRVPGRKPPPGVSYAPIPRGQQVGPGGQRIKPPMPHEDPRPIYQGPNQIQISAGYTPNYTALMKQDPGYLAAINAGRAAEATGAAQRREQIRQAYIQYGGDYAGATDKYGDIDQATRDLAAQNQYSTLATLARTYAQNQRQTQQSLAARGALESGELAYGLDQLNTGYGQSRYDAGTALGNQFGQAINAYTGVLGTNQENLTSAIMSAYSNAINNPAYRPREAITAGYDATNSAKYKKPIFSSNGVLYTQDGRVFNG